MMGDERKKEYQVWHTCVHLTRSYKVNSDKIVMATSYGNRLVRKE